jgi:hypothetical protein
VCENSIFTQPLVRPQIGKHNRLRKFLVLTHPLTPWANFVPPFGLALFVRQVQSSSCRSRSSRSCLRLHDQVRRANIASTATVASLNFWSLIVIHASTASTANKPNAVHNRFISTTPTHATAARAGAPQKPGAQGRIRTSVARKERQIYSLLPLTTRPPVHIRPSTPLSSTFLRTRPRRIGPESPVPTVKEHRVPSAAPHSRQNSASVARPYFRARSAI